MFHSRSLAYKKPYGAAPAGMKVEFAAYPRREQGISRMTLWVEEDGQQAEAYPMRRFGLAGARDEYGASFTPPHAGLYWYWFTFDTADGPRFCARGYGGRCEVLDSMGDRFQLTVYDPSYRPPRWFGEGITYNIFPDRFCRDRDPVQPEGEGIAPRVLHENWDDLPVYRPDEHGEILNNDFFGGTLRMGTNATFPPYEFVGDDGNVQGIDADIAAAIADKLGMKVEITDMEFDSLIPALQSDTIDVALAGMTVTPERQESVDFSDSYAKGVQVIIVPEGSDIQTPDDLEGKNIGVQTGTTGDIYCTDDYGQDHVKQFNNGPLAVAALVNGQIDCVVIDQEPAKNYVAANSGLKILDTSYADEDYAIAIKKGNTELLDKVNGALKELGEDGTLQSIVDKYINADAQ